MFYITGDKHGDYFDVYNFCVSNHTTTKDILIILGDAGINYYRNIKDYLLKEDIAKIPITLFCIHGNHEERPNNISTYQTKKFFNGIVYYEKEFPNILFAQDACVYNLNNKKTLVIGGAYSVDKYYRLMHGYNWFSSEQPDEKTKKKVMGVLSSMDNKIDVILSHTCPYKYMPREMFLEGLDQNSVDNSTELFLDEIENNAKYNEWYCGHFHTDKKVKKLTFMFNNIKKF